MRRIDIKNTKTLVFEENLKQSVKQTDIYDLFNNRN